jgi:RNA polymerase sigma factor (TIGR02999 family)
MLNTMSNIARLFDAAAAGDPSAAADLLPLVYDELRTLAAARLAAEKPGQTLQPTALVHEAYLRLIGPDGGPEWNGRGHFFGAAAEAMRRILVENARRKESPKHGGGRARLDLDEVVVGTDHSPEQVVELDEVLTRLRGVDAVAARLVELRFFVGLTMEQAAAALGIPLRTAERDWTFARTWLHRELSGPPPAGN